MEIALNQQILRTDVAGMPLEWVDYRDAVRLYYTEQVAYECGTLLLRVCGGTNASSGRRSVNRKVVESFAHPAKGRGTG